ncbi:MAG: GNAT family N-acetyltransferase [Chloroflexota bacterium]
MEITIQAERPDSADAIRLIDELTETLSGDYPPEHSFGYSVQKLIEQNVQFYVIRVDGEPAGCGGVQIYEDEPPYGELKRMYVRPGYRGLGLAKTLLRQLEAFTREAGVNILRLETGTLQTEAIGLYKKWGFVEVGPFGEYTATPSNIFYEMQLTDDQ